MLRDALRIGHPDLVDFDVNVMLTQRSDGTLIIGDSHHTESIVDAFWLKALPTHFTVQSATYWVWTA